MRKAMLRNFVAVFLLALALFLPFFTGAAEELVHAGFLPSNIWYSKEPFFAGERIRMYTVLYNSSERDIIGEVIFFDNSQNIGTAAFSLAHGRVQDVWIDWTAAKGSHNVYAELTNVRAGLPGEALRPVTLAQATSGRSEREVDADTDNDGIGDKDDADDDNDGIADSTELQTGSNPLAADSDKDGLNDADDPQPLSADAAAADAVSAAVRQAGVESFAGRAAANVLETVVAAAERLDDFRAEQAAASDARIEALRALREAEAGTDAAGTATQKNRAGTEVPALATRSQSGIAGDDDTASEQRTTSTTSPLSPLQALAFYGNYALYGIFAWRAAFYGLLAITAWFVLKAGFRRIARRRRRF